MYARGHGRVEPRKPRDEYRYRYRYRYRYAYTYIAHVATDASSHASPEMKRRAIL